MRIPFVAGGWTFCSITEGRRRLVHQQRPLGSLRLMQEWFELCETSHFLGRADDLTPPFTPNLEHNRNIKTKLIEVLCLHPGVWIFYGIHINQKGSKVLNYAVKVSVKSVIM